MIAGYFAVGSYDRKGFGRFIGDRFKRLIIPILIYMIVVAPFIDYIELGNKFTGFNIANFLSSTGVMWFATALFIFSLIYGIMRLLFHIPAPDAGMKQIKPSFFKAVALIFIIAACAFLIRIVQPIGTSILNMQLCYFASYIVLFIVGVIAYRHNLFAKISYNAGKRWLICGIVLGLILCLGIIISALKSGNTTALLGGFT